LADNTIGKIIDTLLRAELFLVIEIGFAPPDDAGVQLLFRLVVSATALGRPVPLVNSTSGLAFEARCGRQCPV
jgi:hypothetical protein